MPLVTPDEGAPFILDSLRFCYWNCGVRVYGIVCGRERAASSQLWGRWRCRVHIEHCRQPVGRSHDMNVVPFSLQALATAGYSSWTP